MEGDGGWKGNRGGPGEHSYIGEVDVTGHLRKRTFRQAFVPAANQQVQVRPPCSLNGPGHGRGLLPTPRWPYAGAAGGYGIQEGTGNVNGVGRAYTENVDYNGRMFHHLDPIQNQYINGMLQPLPLRKNASSMGFQGIHGAVPLVRMPPAAVSSINYDYSNAPVAVIPPWHQQQEQHQRDFRAHGESNAFPDAFHGHRQMSSVDSINDNNNETNMAITNTFAESMNSVINCQPCYPEYYPTSPELPPPVLPLETPPPISDSSPMLPLPLSRPYIGFAMSSSPDKQKSTAEQSSFKKQETARPKLLEVKKSTSSAVLIGKRPGGRHLPTGVIKRPDPVPSAGNLSTDAKNSRDGPASPKGAWSRYMAEVERYRSQSCSDETPNRPLVK